MSSLLKKAALWCFAAAVGCDLHAREQKDPFSFEAAYLGDAYYNALGGLKRGGGFMGMGSIRIGFDMQPDVQYILHPSGSMGKTDNALVGLLRLKIGF